MKKQKKNNLEIGSHERYCCNTHTHSHSKDALYFRLNWQTWAEAAVLAKLGLDLVEDKPGLFFPRIS